MSPAPSTPFEAQALLSKHFPVYHIDYREKLRVISLNRYVESKTLEEDDSVTAVAVRRAGGGWLLHYLCYYDADGGLNLGFTTIDEHRYDVEHLVVEVDANGAVTGVLYQPHASKEHFWIRGAADLARVLVGAVRPLVYSSYGKHGCYPVPGLVLRYGGFASDSCLKPVRQKYVPVAPSPKVLKTEKIDGVFPALPPRLRGDLSAKPVARLDDVRTRMLFARFW